MLATKEYQRSSCSLPGHISAIRWLTVDVKAVPPAVNQGLSLDAKRQPTHTRLRPGNRTAAIQRPVHYAMRTGQLSGSPGTVCDELPPRYPTRRPSFATATGARGARAPHAKVAGYDTEAKTEMVYLMD